MLYWPSGKRRSKAQRSPVDRPCAYALLSDNGVNTHTRTSVLNCDTPITHFCGAFRRRLTPFFMRRSTAPSLWIGLITRQTGRG